MESSIYPMFDQNTFSNYSEIKRLSDICSDAFIFARSSDWFYKEKYLTAKNNIWKDYSRYVKYYDFIEILLKKNFEEDSDIYLECHEVLDVGLGSIHYRMLKMGNGIITGVEVKLDKFAADIAKITAATGDLLEKMLELDFDFELSVNEIIKKIRATINYIEDIAAGDYLEDDSELD